MAFTDTRGEVVAPSALRISISKLYPDSNFFQEVNLHILLVPLFFLSKLVIKFIYFSLRYFKDLDRRCYVI